MSVACLRSAHARLRRASARLLLAGTLSLAGARADAQVRERPVPFDSAGRVSAITPPMAARRAKLAGAIARGAHLAGNAPRADSMPTVISEPVRGQFVASQTALGALLSGPAASALVGDAAGGAAAYLITTGVTFFTAAHITQRSPVSRAQNHLSAHSAVRGAIAGDLLRFAIAGDPLQSNASGAAILAGGLLGDVIGFQLAQPMTDAEAHGTSHGSTVTALLATGVLGATGALRQESSARPAALGIAAGALGYPLGLRYVRGTPYRLAWT